MWKEHIFATAVSGEMKEQLHVLKISLKDGSTLWQRDFVGTQKVKDNDAVSRGAPTPLVDGDRVYVAFESGDIFSLTHEGEVLWQRSFVKEYGEIKGPHGYASSPVLAGDVVVLQVSHSGPSYILGMHKETGETAWKVDHPSQTGWSTPCVYQNGDHQVVVISTSGSVRGLNGMTGEEEWNVQNVQGNSTASPSLSEYGIVIGSGGDREGGGGRGRRSSGRGEGDKGEASGNEESSGVVSKIDQKTTSDKKTEKRGSCLIKLGGKGDVTESHVAWSSSKLTTGYASPLVAGEYAYFVNRVGVVQCVEMKTGEIKWTHRLPGQVWASPIAHEGKILFFCKEGNVITMQGGPEAKEISESTISSTDVVYGVAAVDGSWLVRTGRGLYRITGAPNEGEVK